MRFLASSIVIALVIVSTAANDRSKRQATYQSYGGNFEHPAQQHRQPAQQQQAYQQPQPQQYAGGQVQHYPAQQPARPSRHRGSAPDEEEKDEGPHPLQLLLEKSKFDCGGKGDGYYADSDVGCQAFHYCISGQKHSMMCPEGTVFHQVHLNCVPADQDICSKSNKFFFVNDYLNKPLEQRGPNNTVQYHQRYYPEGYAVGDPFIPPAEGQREPPAATYGLGPAYREQAPPSHYQQQPAAQPHRPQQQAHRPAPQQQAAYAPAQVQAYAPQQQQRPSHQAQAPRPQQAQVSHYGYGAQQQQAHLQQALQAQRAYAQQQQHATAPQQHLFAQAAPRQRYA